MRRFVQALARRNPLAQLEADANRLQLYLRIDLNLIGLNPSTVYRNLELLVAEGLVLRTNLGEDRAFYEPSHEHPHHRVVCERCGAVAHLHDNVLGKLPARIETASGFALGESEATFFGHCPTCRARG